jgi:hypothetical protein
VSKVVKDKLRKCVEIRNTYKILIRNPERELPPLGKHTHRSEDNMKMGLKK